MKLITGPLQQPTASGENPSMFHRLMARGFAPNAELSPTQAILPTPLGVMTALIR